MVKLDEVPDEAFVRDNKTDDGDWDTDSESEASSIASDEPESESLVDRISALKDVVPPAQRRKLASSVAATKEWGWWGVTGLAKTAWVISVSAIMLGVPFASAYAEEQMYAEEEKRRKMAESSNDVLAPGATSLPQAQQSL